MNTQKPNGDEERLIKSVKDQLNSETEKFDEHTLDRLAEARRQALNAIPESKSKNSWRNPRVLGAISLCAVLLVALFIGLPQMGHSPGNTEISLLSDLGPEELEELFTGDDVAMLENDIEFYVWLESIEGQEG